MVVMAASGDVSDGEGGSTFFLKEEDGSSFYFFFLFSSFTSQRVRDIDRT